MQESTISSTGELRGARLGILAHRFNQANSRFTLQNLTTGNNQNQNSLRATAGFVFTFGAM